MKISLIMFAFLLGNVMFGQNNEGVIIYEDKRNIHKSLPPEMEAMKDRIPEFRTSEKILYFSGNETTYRAVVKEKKKDEEFRGERRRGRFGRNNENNIYYTDLEAKTSIDSRDFFGKKFLIKGERESKKWKVTGEQKMVGDYLCQKATYQDSLVNEVIWFTPMIPVASGPDDYFGLPGLILHVDINDGERLITAQSIELKPLEDGQIEMPTEGKEMTSEEFEALREEKMEEMRQERGGPGRGRFFGRGR